MSSLHIKDLFVTFGLLTSKLWILTWKFIKYKTFMDIFTIPFLTLFCLKSCLFNFYYVTFGLQTPVCLFVCMSVCLFWYFGQYVRPFLSVSACLFVSMYLCRYVNLSLFHEQLVLIYIDITHYGTMCPRSSDPFYIVTYCIK